MQDYDEKYYRTPEQMRSWMRGIAVLCFFIGVLLYFLAPNWNRLLAFLSSLVGAFFLWVRYFASDEGCENLRSQAVT